MTEVSKLKFEFKEMAYIVMAAIAWFTQLSILSNKIETYKHKTEMNFQGMEYRLRTVEVASKAAILPTPPSIKGEDE